MESAQAIPAKIAVFLVHPDGSEEKLPQEADGFIGRFPPETILCLRVEWPAAASVRAFEANAPHEMRPVEARGMFGITNIFERKVRVRYVGRRPCHAPYGRMHFPENSLRFVRILPLGGSFHLYEAGVTSFEEGLFVTWQDLEGEVGVYKKLRPERRMIETLHCSRFEGERKWPELLEALRGMMKKRMHEVPLWDLDVLPILPLPRSSRQAVIVWFNQASGNGVLRTRAGKMLGFNRASIVRTSTERLPAIKAGDLVEVQLQRPANEGSTLDGWAEHVLRLEENFQGTVFERRKVYRPDGRLIPGGWLQSRIRGRVATLVETWRKIRFPKKGR